MSYCFMRYPGGLSKAVTFSYDDGVKQDLRLAKICDKYGIKCTFNICGVSAEPENECRLTEDEIKKYILAAGHEVGVHGFEHKAPGNCRDIEIINDVLNSRKNLESAFGRIINGMAYPDCGIIGVNAQRFREIRSILKSLGIIYARTLGNDNNRFEMPEDFYAWMPTAHHDNSKVREYAEEFAELDPDKLYWANRSPKLFYLWGHSFEFDQNDNWHHFENICKILGQRNDIWYATNGEICRYKKAYDSLVFNASGDVVFNPSSRDVWFVSGEKLYCVKAGKESYFSK